MKADQNLFICLIVPILTLIEPFKFSFLSIFLIRIPDDFNFDAEYALQEKLLGGKHGAKHGQWAILDFDQPIVSPLKSVVIGSRLDAENPESCRIACYGIVMAPMEKEGKYPFAGLKVYKPVKEREGTVSQVTPSGDWIVKGLFGKDTDIERFRGLKVTTADGASGVIDGTFGKSGKIKVIFESSGTESVRKGARVTLRLRKFIFADNTKKKLCQ